MEENNSKINNTESYLEMNIYNQPPKSMNLGTESNDNINLSNMSNAPLPPLPITNYNAKIGQIAGAFPDNIRNNYPITEYRNQPQRNKYHFQSQNSEYPSVKIENNRYNINNRNNNNYMNNMKNVQIVQTNEYINQNNSYNNGSNIYIEQPVKIETIERIQKKKNVINVVVLFLLLYLLL